MTPWIKLLYAVHARTTSKTLTSSFLAIALLLLLVFPARGKSSLAFDTLYAEGQRRYVESLSLMRANFISDGKPDVDHIEGLSPAISIEQSQLHNSLHRRHDY